MSQADSSATVTVEDDGLVGFVRPCPPLLGKTTLKNGGGGGGILCNRNGELGSNANSLSLSLSQVRRHGRLSSNFPPCQGLIVLLRTNTHGHNSSRCDDAAEARTAAVSPYVLYIGAPCERKDKTKAEGICVSPPTFTTSESNIAFGCHCFHTCGLAVVTPAAARKQHRAHVCV